MKSEMTEMEIGMIRHAAWNPRTVEELSDAHPAMQALIKSLKIHGLINPVTVWDTGTLCDNGMRKYLCIAGNRRLEACRYAQIGTVQVKLVSEIDEDEAKAITRDENEVRFGVDPIMDAGLVKSYLDRGVNQAEVAALLGVSEATVCRRAKLCDLSDEVREVAKGGDIDTRSLELLAAYPVDIQKKAAKDIKRRMGYQRVSMDRVRGILNGCTKEINTTVWWLKDPERLQRCANCPHCTGCQADLFAGMEGDGNDDFGRCLDPSCWHKREEDARTAVLDAKIAKTSGGKGADGRKKMDWLSEYNAGKYADVKWKNKRQGRYTYVYYYFDYQNGDLLAFRWGPDPKEIDDAFAEKEKANAEAEKAKREQSKAHEEVLRSARHKISDYFWGVEDDEKMQLDCFLHALDDLGKEELKAFIVQMMDGDLLGEDCWGQEKNRLWAVENIGKLAANLTPEEVSAIREDAED